MDLIYTRLIELGIILLVGGLYYIIKEISNNIKFKKQEKEWIENSFEWNGGRVNKKFAKIVDGQIQWNMN